MQSKKQCQMLDGTAFLGLREPKSGLARDLGDRLQSRNVSFGTSGDCIGCSERKKKGREKHEAKENDTKRAGGRAYDCIHVVTDSVCLRWRDGTACDVCNLLGAGAADCGYRPCVNYERGVQFPLYRNRGGRSVRLQFPL